MVLEGSLESLKFNIVFADPDGGPRRSGLAKWAWEIQTKLLNN